MLQFTLRTLLLVTTLVAGLLGLQTVGGGSVATTTLVVGLVIGGCISFLFRRSNIGMTPVVSAVAVAILSVILGIYLIDFDAEGWDNPFGKLPWGLDLLFWFAFFGAFVGAAIGLMLCTWRRWRASQVITEN